MSYERFTGDLPAAFAPFAHSSMSRTLPRRWKSAPNSDRWPVDPHL
jgi:hypothetical protein